jgi:hypothetical protein
LPLRLFTGFLFPALSLLPGARPSLKDTPAIGSILTICLEIVKNNLRQRPVQVKYPPKRAGEIQQLSLQDEKQKARKRLK